METATSSGIDGSIKVPICNSLEPVNNLYSSSSTVSRKEGKQNIRPYLQRRM